jgi:SET domain-containing protein
MTTLEEFIDRPEKPIRIKRRHWGCRQGSLDEAYVDDDLFSPNLRAAGQFRHREPIVRIGKSLGRGRGVFAEADIEEGDVIEISPVLVIPSDQLEYINQTILRDYVFQWNRINNPNKRGAIALGIGSLFNHSDDPNCDYRCDLTKGLIYYIASRDISIDEEIFVNYGRM